MRPISKLIFTLVLTFGAAVSLPQEHNPAAREPAGQPQVRAQRVIVKFRSRSTDRVQIQATTNATVALAQRTGVAFKQSRDLGAGMHVMSVEPAVVGESMEQTLARLRADPEVEFADPDQRRYVHATPNDPLFTNEWFQKNVEASAINAVDAWDTTQGSSTLVIASIDTGVRYEHPDLQRVSQGGRLLDGFDFVSEDSAGVFLSANDGSGWDADPSDPGDWVNAADRQNSRFVGCSVANSSWHGTRVAGVIGARTNNAQGVAGITWNPQILPLRALGKCGGQDSDIIAAMRWAGGIAVPGTPTNPTPARIINLSLGSTGACPGSYQSAVSELSALGVLVVVSAGNETGHAVSSPANCPGVLAVAAVRHVGSKVGFSNIGTQIGISAPGGNCVNIGPGEPCLFSIDTTTDLGTTVPAGATFTDQFNINVGTSFSAPIVAAVAGLVRSVNPALTPAQVITRLQQSATAFPFVDGVVACEVPTTLTGDQLECNCTTSTCGAGLVDANAAVALALKPFVIVTATPMSPNSGQTVTLVGTGSFVSDSRTISSYAWTVASGGGTTPPVITNANTATASFTAPDAALTLRLTVTDSAGAQDFSDVVVTPIAPPPPPPPNPTPPAAPSQGGGGGGGALEWLTLFAMLLAFGAAQRSRMRLATSSHSFCARR